MDPEELAALNSIINTRRSMAAAQALAQQEMDTAGGGSGAMTPSSARSRSRSRSRTRYNVSETCSRSTSPFPTRPSTPRPRTIHFAPLPFPDLDDEAALQDEACELRQPSWSAASASSSVESLDSADTVLPTRRRSTGMYQLLSSLEKARAAVPIETSWSSGRVSRHLGRLVPAMSLTPTSGASPDSSPSSSPVITWEERQRRREIIRAQRPGGTGMVTLLDGQRIPARMAGDTDVDDMDADDAQLWGFAALERHRARVQDESTESDAPPSLPTPAPRLYEPGESYLGPPPAQLMSSSRGEDPALLSADPAHTSWRTVRGSSRQRMAPHTRVQDDRSPGGSPRAPGSPLRCTLAQSEAGGAGRAAQGATPEHEKPASSAPPAERGRGPAPGKGKLSLEQARELQRRHESEMLALGMEALRKVRGESRKGSATSSASSSTSSLTPSGATPGLQRSASTSRLSPRRSRTVMHGLHADPSVSMPWPSPRLPRRPDARGIAVVPLSQLGERPERPLEGRSRLYQLFYDLDSDESDENEAAAESTDTRRRATTRAAGQEVVYASRLRRNRRSVCDDAAPRKVYGSWDDEFWPRPSATRRLGRG